MKATRFIPLALAALLAACSQDTTAPSSSSIAAPSAAAALLGPGEGLRIISEETDAFGNTTMIAEYAAGVYQSDTTGFMAGSVTIKTVIPQSSAGSSKSPCITSSIVRVETQTGWTSSVKKPGGCDKPIEVQLENKSLKQRADFSFLYMFGKTRIDSGLIN
jgi:hypothetical protein